MERKEGEEGGVEGEEEEGEEEEWEEWEKEGEDLRKYGWEEDEEEEEGGEVEHMACTVEMLNTSKVLFFPIPRPFPFPSHKIIKIQIVETVIIDEIQMISDPRRGWAWTRALLGAPASTVHLCGSPAAIDLVRKIVEEGGLNWV